MITTYINKPDILKWYIYKILLIMRLISVILMVSVLQVSASTFKPKFNYEKKEVALIHIIKEIKKQTANIISWNENNIDVATTKSISFKSATIHSISDRILRTHINIYFKNDKMAEIREKGLPFLIELNALLNVIDVRGRVVDENNRPLMGATVMIKGTKKATSTNSNGEFVLKDVDEKAVLIISFLGYKSKDIKAAEKLRDIQLVHITDKLQEVEINAGYYTVKDRERTGNIARVTADEIGNQPVSNPLEALVGRMAGVNIIQNSGISGGGFTIEVRGRNSLRNLTDNNGNQPLFIVDGVPYPSTSQTRLGFASLPTSSPLNYLNPKNIESIEVLKDADATAIYGSRGSNGVVLITTKNAKSGKTAVDIDFQKGIAKVGVKYDLLHTQQYLEMRKEAFKNDGVAPGATDYDVNGTWDENTYNDWQKLLIGKTSQITSIQGAINGGNENTQISFRGNYHKQSTVYIGDFSDQKASSSLTVNHASKNKKFQANFSSSYLLDHNILPRSDFTEYITLAPNAPYFYHKNGNVNWSENGAQGPTSQNPVTYLRQRYNINSNTFLFNSTLNYKILPSLSIKGNFGYTNLRVRENMLIPISSMNPLPTARGANINAFNTLDTWIIEPQVSYSKDLLDGTFNVLLGSTFQSDTQNGENINGFGYTSDLLLASINAAPTKIAATSHSQYKYTAVFARINYEFKKKYIINLTGRRDGSSRFGPDRQFANFGAVGSAWIFSETKLIKNNFAFISFGKLRSSYGITGSDQIPNYGYLETYSASPVYQSGSGIVPTRLANADFSWETNKKLEGAIDLGFFDKKVLFSTSVYRNISSNQLVGYSLPSTTGFSSVQFNLPATVKNVGIEFEVSTQNIVRKSFTWNTRFNLTIPRNVLLKYPEIENSSYANTYKVGESIFNSLAYHYLGLDPKTGLHTFEDINNNGSDMDFGSDFRIPTRPFTSQLFGGLTNSFSISNFQCDLFFQFAKLPAKKLTTYAPGRLGNQLKEVMDRWTGPGDNSDVQKFSQTPEASQRYFNFAFSSNAMDDASFIKLKNVSLSWQAPQRFVESINLKSLRFYIQGQNLFTITKYGGDPETQFLTRLPLLTTIATGIQVGL